MCVTAPTTLGGEVPTVLSSGAQLYAVVTDGTDGRNPLMMIYPQPPPPPMVLVYGESSQPGNISDLIGACWPKQQERLLCICMEKNGTRMSTWLRGRFRGRFVFKGVQPGPTQGGSGAAPGGGGGGAGGPSKKGLNFFTQRNDTKGV